MAKRLVPAGKIQKEESLKPEGQCKPDNISAHPPGLDQIIRALNLQARYDLEDREGKTRSGS